MRSMTADRSFGQSMMTIRRWSIRRWVVAGIASALTALFIGVPTGIVRTGFYTRMTPVLWWNYPIWVASLLSLLAVGCPVCNKLVVLAVGATGAMNLWAPVQPVLGVVSLTLLLWAFARRLRSEVACAVPTASRT
jgi:hypothetical protein